MNRNVFETINTFPDLNILVIGEALLDTYLKGSSERLCREAPVPVVDIREREDVPGGAANTAVNIRSLGGTARFVSVIGNDIEATILLRALEEKGVATDTVLVDSERRTLAKQRIVSDGQILLRFDQGRTHPLDAQAENAILAMLPDLFHQSNGVVISDYGYGIITPRILQALIELQREDPHVIIADSKHLPKYRELGVTAVKPNYKEAVELLGLPARTTQQERLEQILQYGERLIEICNTQIAAITLDCDGSLVFECGQPLYRTYARCAPHSQAAGAGDTFVSGMALALSAGVHSATAAEIASAASSVVVEKPGTVSCHADELKNYFYGDEKFVNNAFVMAARLASLRREGRKIVFTNGVFDILHSGHVSYLSQAKSFGDVLIVGINSDESVRRLKGSSRPINTLEDRAQVLAALSSVDLIIPFGTDTPIELIKTIKPDVYVKGGDYTLETLPEAPVVQKLGGKVHILSYLDDRSTTGMIERIRKVYVKTDHHAS